MEELRRRGEALSAEVCAFRRDEVPDRAGRPDAAFAFAFAAFVLAFGDGSTGSSGSAGAAGSASTSSGAPPPERAMMRWSVPR